MPKDINDQPTPIDPVYAAKWLAKQRAAEAVPCGSCGVGAGHRCMYSGKPSRAASHLRRIWDARNAGVAV